MICKICGKECKNFVGLGHHILTHKINSESYYNEYIRKINEGFCLTCGKQTSFISLSDGYKKHCNSRCAQLDPNTQEKLKNTNIKKYGCENVFQSNIIKEKIQTSIHAHYGEEGLKNNKIRKKKKQTLLERYGTENYVNINKIKQTNLERYGAENIYASEYGKQKCKETKLTKYGDEYYHNSKKAIQTYLNTVKNRTEAEKRLIGQHISNSLKNLSDEAKLNRNNKISAKLKHYYKNLSPEQYNELCIKLRNYGKNQTIRSKIKSINTKKKNNTFAASPVEDKFYNDLLDFLLKSDIERQYIDENRYPFACDFYIKSLDLFIEINNHWTHGLHPYDKNNAIDKTRLKEIKKRTKYSNYYNTTIKVWTKLDPKKYNYAIKNNLNYLRLYNNTDMQEALVDIRRQINEIKSRRNKTRR